MISETRRKISKFVLQIACQLIWFAGLVLGLCGVYLLLNFKRNGLFFLDVYITLPAVVALACAVALFASGVFGCWVSVRDSSTCLQALFAYLLIIVFCLEATAAALAFVNIGKIGAELTPLQNIFQNYSGSNQDPASRAVDSIQEQMQCCGVWDYTDWETTPWFKHTGKFSVPQSCCNSTFHACNGSVSQPFMLYPQGCRERLEDGISFILHLIIYYVVAATLVQIVGLVSVAQLMKQQPRREYQILDKDRIN
ncbi:tetraspanin 37 [Conger conger]|uniref:tetraspanin 37 n=1 Tax=Conger conger TaxID=82655 RepID=UPI002A5AF225|nr:tetraspanin 37 [Conger conger]